VPLSGHVRPARAIRPASDPSSAIDRKRDPDCHIAAFVETPGWPRRSHLRRPKNGLVITLRAKRLSALQTRLDAGAMPMNLRCHHTSLQALQNELSFGNRQSNGSRRYQFLPFIVATSSSMGLPGTTSVTSLRVHFMPLAYKPPHTLACSHFVVHLIFAMEHGTMSRLPLEEEESKGRSNLVRRHSQPICGRHACL
jgi:hypothetical protein